jgi:hypothetical protein
MPYTFVPVPAFNRRRAMGERLTIDGLFTQFKTDSATDRALFTLDTTIKLALLLLLTAGVWALVMRGSITPTQPPYSLILLCLAVYVLTIIWFIIGFCRAGWSMWNYERVFFQDLSKSLLGDREISERIARRFGVVSIRACKLDLESGIKRSERDMSLVGPFSVVTSALTVGLGLSSNTLHLPAWINGLAPAFMLGIGSGAIFKSQFIRKLTRYDFIVAAALQLAAGDQ